MSEFVVTGLMFLPSTLPLVSASSLVFQPELPAVLLTDESPGPIWVFGSLCDFLGFGFQCCVWDILELLWFLGYKYHCGLW